MHGHVAEHVFPAPEAHQSRGIAVRAAGRRLLRLCVDMVVVFVFLDARDVVGSQIQDIGRHVVVLSFRERNHLTAGQKAQSAVGVCDSLAAKISPALCRFGYVLKEATGPLAVDVDSSILHCGQRHLRCLLILDIDSPERAFSRLQRFHKICDSRVLFLVLIWPPVQGPACRLRRAARGQLHTRAACTTWPAEGGHLQLRDY